MKHTLIILTILIGFVFAENPTLNVQGVLRDDNGNAVPDGENYQLTFYLYDAVEGGSSIWNEEHTGVSVANGVYSAELGGTASLGGLTFATPYYLGIAVNGGAQSTPRIPLSMSPYALSVRGTSNVFPNDGTVGIGITTPSGGGLEINSFTSSWGAWHNALNLTSPSHAGIFYEPAGLMMGFHGNRNIYFGDTQLGQYRMVLGEEVTTIGGNLNVGGNAHVNGKVFSDVSGSAYDLWIQGSPSTAGGDDRNLALLGTDDTNSDKLYVNYSSEYEGGTQIGGPVNLMGNVQVNSFAPIMIRSYYLGETCDINYNTGVNTTDWSAVIVGVDEGHFDYEEYGSGWSYVCMANKVGTTWHIKARERCDTAPDWRVHVMFIRKEMVSDQRTIWPW